MQKGDFVAGENCPPAQICVIYADRTDLNMTNEATIPKARSTEKMITSPSASSTVSVKSADAELTSGQ